MTVQRPDGRAADALRPISIERGYTRHADGSVLVCFGDTRVLCTAFLDASVPRFLRGQNKGWLTAEYGMLPAATHSRGDREAVRGKQGGRTMEIQRLIGRALRAAVDLRALGELTVRIDCDVLQADGGTRTASITGAWVALVDALATACDRKLIATPLHPRQVAAISVGVWQGRCVLDLDYAEDSTAETDMNIVMMQPGGFIEVQGTAEAAPFDDRALNEMLALARSGIERLFALQTAALKQP